jgi:hypothetical protein
MSNIESTILGITEPTITLDEMLIGNYETEDSLEGKGTVAKLSKVVGAYYPYIEINGLQIAYDMIDTFTLDVKGKVPYIRLRLVDKNNLFMSRHFPKDGDVINFLIRANNEKSFKPIRIDFDILNISPSLNSIGSRIFNIYGQMKVPGLLAEVCEAYPDLTSFDTFLEVSQELQLGFASNVEDTSDKMTWINPFDTRIKFLKDTISNSYLNENSFFSWFIDQYYTLNFVEMNSLFSQDEEVETGEMYSQGYLDSLMNMEEDSGITSSQVMFTNLLQYQATSKYISDYKMINNSGEVFLKNGYKRYCQYFNIEDNSKNGEILSEFVDPFTTEGTEDMIHLKGRYIGDSSNRQSEGITDTQIKYKYVGKQHSYPIGNMHENYLYSQIMNYQNNQEINKMGMIVDLEQPDLSIRKGQRIPIYIFEYGSIEKSVFKNADENIDNENVDEDLRSPIFNKFLSGFYIIIGFDYIFTSPGPIKQRVYMLKREFSSSL